MSSRPPKDEDEPEEPPQEPKPEGSSADPRTEEPMLGEEDGTQAHRSRIVILGERDIPFEEERPPNHLPNFQVKIHRVSRPEKPREVGT